jgi:hypothetical protein
MYRDFVPWLEKSTKRKISFGSLAMLEGGQRDCYLGRNEPFNGPWCEICFNYGPSINTK